MSGDPVSKMRSKFCAPGSVTVSENSCPEPYPFPRRAPYDRISIASARDSRRPAVAVVVRRRIAIASDRPVAARARAARATATATHASVVVQGARRVARVRVVDAVAIVARASAGDAGRAVVPRLRRRNRAPRRADVDRVAHPEAARRKIQSELSDVPHTDPRDRTPRARCRRFSTAKNTTTTCTSTGAAPRATATTTTGDAGNDRNETRRNERCETDETTARARDRRHVVLPPDIAKLLPKNRLLTEVRARDGDGGGRDGSTTRARRRDSFPRETKED